MSFMIYDLRIMIYSLFCVNLRSPREIGKAVISQGKSAVNEVEKTKPKSAVGRKS